MTEKEFMKQALDVFFFPELKKIGFNGEFPHYRRITSDRVDVVSIVFDNWGGSFALEISYAFLNSKETNLFSESDAKFPQTITSSKCINRKRLPAEGEWIYFCDLIKIKTGDKESTYSLTQNQKEILLKKTPAQNISIVEEVGDGIYCRSAMTAARLLKNAKIWWNSKNIDDEIDEQSQIQSQSEIVLPQKENTKKRWSIFGKSKKNK